MPWVKIVDPFAGEKVGMLVEVDLEDGTTAAGLYTHKYLNECVGYGLQRTLYLVSHLCSGLPCQPQVPEQTYWGWDWPVSNLATV